MADSIHNIDDDEVELPANNWNSSISVSEALRMAEAILFASAEPVTEKALRSVCHPVSTLLRCLANYRRSIQSAASICGRPAAHGHSVRLLISLS